MGRPYDIAAKASQRADGTAVGQTYLIFGLSALGYQVAVLGHSSGVGSAIWALLFYAVQLPSLTSSCRIVHVTAML
jgi:hypothetical protein